MENAEEHIEFKRIQSFYVMICLQILFYSLKGVIENKCSFSVKPFNELRKKLNT